MNEVMQTILQRRSCKQYSDRPVRRSCWTRCFGGDLGGQWDGPPSRANCGSDQKGGCGGAGTVEREGSGQPGCPPLYGAPVVLAVLADPAVNTAVEDGSLIIEICFWRRSLWDWEPAGFTGRGRNLPGLRASAVGPLGIRDYIVAPLHLGLCPGTTAGCSAPKRGFYHKKFNFELQNRRNGDILKSNQLSICLEENL